MYHNCHNSNLVDNVKISSIEKENGIHKWYLRIGSETCEIQHCPFCDGDLPIDREYLYALSPKDDTRFFVESNGVQALWDAGVLYEVPIMFKDKEGKEIRAIAIAVNCNDVFYWACADYEFLVYGNGDIQSLYEHCFDIEGNKKRWGSTIWACLKRGMRPQHPIEDQMKKENVWPPELEALPVRGNTG